MKLMLLTGDTNFALKAQDSGVDRIFLDLGFVTFAVSTRILWLQATETDSSSSLNNGL